MCSFFPSLEFTTFHLPPFTHAPAPPPNRTSTLTHRGRKGRVSAAFQKNLYDLIVTFLGGNVEGRVEFLCARIRIFLVLEKKDGGLRASRASSRMERSLVLL